MALRLQDADAMIRAVVDRFGRPGETEEDGLWRAAVERRHQPLHVPAVADEAIGDSAVGEELDQPIELRM